MRRKFKDIATLPRWAEDNGVKLNGVTISASPSGHGTGLIATTDHYGHGTILIQVPAHLLLNESKIWTLAADDYDLKLLLKAQIEFAKTTRGAMLLFLLLQISHTSPDVEESCYENLPIGKDNAFSEYIQYIRTEESLPLLWSAENAMHLWGTSLQRHTESKLRFLVKEFAQVKLACRKLPWYEVWFGNHGCVNFEDWLTVDAMWRSRGMELSDPASNQRSSCLMPVMDMTNHHRDGIAAYRAVLDHGDKPYGELILKQTVRPEETNHPANTLQYGTAGATITAGTEIMISYGSNRAATGMIFSYGFLDDRAFSDAGAMALELTIRKQDPLADARVEALQLEPRIQIYTSGDGQGLRFVSSAIWAMAVNEKDGLKFLEQPSTDQQRTRNIQMYFKDILITSKSHLLELLKHDRAWIVFQARAYGYVYQQVMTEIDAIATEAERRANEASPRSSQKDLCDRLRYLEYMLLLKARDYFLAQAQELMSTKDFQDYEIFLKGGPALRPFSEAELWYQFQDEHDRENRKQYVDSLLQQLSSITLTRGTETNDMDGWGSEAKWDDGTEEQDSNGIEAETLTSAGHTTDFFLRDRNLGGEENWYYDGNGKTICDFIFSNDDDDDDGFTEISIQV